LNRVRSGKQRGETYDGRSQETASLARRKGPLIMEQAKGLYKREENEPRVKVGEREEMAWRIDENGEKKKEEARLTKKKRNASQKGRTPSPSEHSQKLGAVVGAAEKEDQKPTSEKEKGGQPRANS